VSSSAKIDGELARKSSAIKFRAEQQESSKDDVMMLQPTSDLAAREKFFMSHCRRGTKHLESHHCCMIMSVRKADATVTCCD
jgi:hypothetical protein